MKTYTCLDRRGNLTKFVGSRRGLLWSGRDAPAVGVFADDLPSEPAENAAFRVVLWSGHEYVLPLGRVREFPIVFFAGYGPQYRIPLAAMREVTGHAVLRSHAARRRRRKVEGPVLPFGGTL